ncbi:MAG TPA: hypothetical protein VJM69_06345 [Dehalococcoidia bacterium]|nr:hypothetical protein [Dehalococcoidia bacterium]
MLTPSPQASPTPAPGPKLIYREFGQDVDSLFLADTRLGEVRPVASLGHAPGYGVQASLSPDGREAAYTALAAEALDRTRQAELWLLALGDSGPRKLAGGFDLQIPLWSPRGEALALRRYGSQGVPELVLVSRDGAVTSLVPGAGALDLFPAAFSPDGRFIYYVKLTAQGSELGRAPVGGGNVTTIMGSLGKGLSRDWRLSPDGRSLAYLAPVEYEGRIRLRIHVASVGSDGRPVTVQGPLGLDHFAPLWHPKGQEIALGSTPAGGQAEGVFLVEESGSARPFGSPPARGCDVPVAWSPDGSILAVRSFAVCSIQEPGPSRYVLVFADGARREMKTDAEFIGWVP